MNHLFFFYFVIIVLIQRPSTSSTTVEDWISWIILRLFPLCSFAIFFYLNWGTRIRMSYIYVFSVFRKGKIELFFIFSPFETWFCCCELWYNCCDCFLSISMCVEKKKHRNDFPFPDTLMILYREIWRPHFSSSHFSWHVQIIKEETQETKFKCYFSHCSLPFSFTTYYLFFLDCDCGYLENPPPKRIHLCKRWGSRLCPFPSYFILQC